jgi:superfamily II DNA or RNA helicase
MPVNAAEQPDNSPIPTIKLSKTALISIAAKKLSYSPHKWQAHLAHALLSWENRVIVSTAATGAGKTLTSWLPILTGETAMTFIIVLLNVLGQQMADMMNETIYSADSKSKEGPR